MEVLNVPDHFRMRVDPKHISQSLPFIPFEPANMYYPLPSTSPGFNKSSFFLHLGRKTPLTKGGPLLTLQSLSSAIRRSVMQDTCVISDDFKRIFKSMNDSELVFLSRSMQNRTDRSQLEKKLPELRRSPLRGWLEDILFSKMNTILHSNPEMPQVRPSCL